MDGHDLHLSTIEASRQEKQRHLDDSRPMAERNRLGQFATPPDLARDIASLAYSCRAASAPVTFLDPAIGTGAFFSAVLQVFPQGSIQSALGFGIDHEIAAAPRQLGGD